MLLFNIKNSKVSTIGMYKYCEICYLKLFAYLVKNEQYIKIKFNTLIETLNVQN